MKKKINKYSQHSVDSGVKAWNIPFKFNYGCTKKEGKQDKIPDVHISQDHNLDSLDVLMHLTFVCVSLVPWQEADLVHFAWFGFDATNGSQASPLGELTGTVTNDEWTRSECVTWTLASADAEHHTELSVCNLWAGMSWCWSLQTCLSLAQTGLTIWCSSKRIISTLLFPDSDSNCNYSNPHNKKLPIQKYYHQLMSRNV